MQAIMQKKRTTGFTLVELVIAVIVLVALILIALPVYSNVTANAKRRTVEANLKIIDGQLPFTGLPRTTARRRKRN